MLVVNVDHIDTATLPTHREALSSPIEIDDSSIIRFSEALSEDVTSYHGTFLDSHMNFSLAVSEHGNVSGAGQNDTLGGDFSISGVLKNGVYEIVLSARLVSADLTSSTSSMRAIEMP